MKIKEVPFSWIPRWGYRLDVGPFVGGAVETRIYLEKAPYTKEPLLSLTAGHDGGIYNGPMFRRRYVDSPEYGVPFLGSSEMLRADFGGIAYLRRQDAESPKLIYLQLTRGTTLISCSGTIGRTVYVRPDMEGMWTSQHIIKVVPDPSRIPPGYLFAFLSSKFGVPMVTSGTYGAIIQHIEPQHIADLPVPRLGDDTEAEAHELVERAATSRSKAVDARAEAIRSAKALIKWTAFRPHPNVGSTSSRDIHRRMDAFHHSHLVAGARGALIKAPKSKRIGSVTQAVFEPNRGARKKVDDPSYGVPFLSSSEVFALDPIGDYSISRKHTSDLQALLITQEDVLVPRSGQIGGIIGRAVLPVPTTYGNAASEHLVRIRCRTHEDACYLWAVLASEPGYWALVGTAFGSSIPSLDCELISRLGVPWVDGTEREAIVRMTQSALRLQDEAIRAERAAIARVERAIEEAA